MVATIYIAAIYITRKQILYLGIVLLQTVP